MTEVTMANKWGGGAIIMLFGIFTFGFASFGKSSWRPLPARIKIDFFRKKKSCGVFFFAANKVDHL
jgi:hypothetical protein